VEPGNRNSGGQSDKLPPAACSNMTIRRVSILVPDISSNIVWAATAIARALRAKFEVEIVGPDLGTGVYAMFRGLFEFHAIPAPRIYRVPEFFADCRRLGAALTGDLIIAMKAYADTVPVALREKRRHGKSVLVYLDEWDAAPLYERPRLARVVQFLRECRHPLDEAYFPLVERMLVRADGVIATSSFVQRKFGGWVVPLGVDTNSYAPQPPAALAGLRRKLGLEKERLIVFGGLVRPHKGVELILEALALIADPGLKLLVVGPETETVAAFKAHPRWAPYLVCAGAQAKAQMPLFLDLAELIVIAQDDSRLGPSQVPCKISEAMAMAKPVIATAVSDLPDILAGCGRIVPPGDARALAGEIQGLLADRIAAEALGRAAREKCVRLYSDQKMAETLAQIIEGLG